MGTRQVDIAIVGYGIEGRMVGLSISKGFDKVVAFDTPHPLNLGADSFRNQSVLHFGIFYGENNIISAHRMLYSGEEMHKVVGLPVPQDGGILCVKEEDVEKVFAIAKKLKLSSKVRLINDYKAEKQITEFYKSGFAYLRIPETVFPEKQILERTDLLARENGLEVIRAKVTLQSHPKDTTRCLVNTGTELIEPEFLIICAGAGTPKLFEQIGIKHNLAVVCTPILRFPFDSIMSTRYFVDKSEEGLSGRGLFVVRHDLETSGTNCLVIAKSIRRLVLKDEIENKREVKDHEEEEIRKAAFACLKRLALAKRVRLVGVRTSNLKRGA